MVVFPDAEAMPWAMFKREVVSNVSSSDWPDTLAYAEGNDKIPLLLMEILLVDESNSYVPLDSFPFIV